MSLLRPEYTKEARLAKARAVPQGTLSSKPCDTPPTFGLIKEVDVPSAGHPLCTGIPFNINMAPRKSLTIWGKRGSNCIAAVLCQACDLTKDGGNNREPGPIERQMGTKGTRGDAHGCALAVECLRWNPLFTCLPVHMRTYTPHAHNLYTPHAHNSYTPHAHNSYTPHAHNSYTPHAYNSYTPHAHNLYTPHAHNSYTPHAHNLYTPHAHNLYTPHAHNLYTCIPLARHARVLRRG